MLAFTLKEKGGLNHTIFLLLFFFLILCIFFCLHISLKQLLRGAYPYVVLAASKIYWLQKISDIPLRIAFGCSSKY